MSLADISLLAVTIFFSIYGLACGIECGIAMRLLNSNTDRLRNLFTPFWEVTNVFLVFGFVSLIMLFNGALQQLSTALLSTLAVAFFALLTRSCTVLTLFYLQADRMSKIGVWLFALTSFAVPLTFTSSGVYLLTGKYFWLSLSGWLLMAAATLGMIAIGKLFISGTPNPKRLLSDELFFAAWLMVLGSFVPLALLHSGGHFQKWPIAALDLLSIYGLLVTYLVIIGRTKFKLKYYAGMMALVTPLLLVWANRPFLVAGQIKIDDAFGASSYAGALLVGSAIILPIVSLGIWLFIKLIRTPS